MKLPLEEMWEVSTVQDMFGGLMKKEFPEASECDLWGSLIRFFEGGDITLTCGGKTKRITNEPRNLDSI